jgi:hypothetical protein
LGVGSSRNKQKALSLLEMSLDANNNWLITELLVNFGYLAVATLQPERAARLWGAAEAWREETGSALMLDTYRYERTVCSHGAKATG